MYCMRFCIISTIVAQCPTLFTYKLNVWRCEILFVPKNNKFQVIDWTMKGYPCIKAAQGGVMRLMKKEGNELGRMKWWLAREVTRERRISGSPQLRSQVENLGFTLSVKELIHSFWNSVHAVEVRIHCREWREQDCKQKCHWSLIILKSTYQTSNSDSENIWVQIYFEVRTNKSI